MWKRDTTRLRARWPQITAGLLIATATLCASNQPVAAMQDVMVVDSVIRCGSCTVELGPPIELQGEYEFGTVPSTVDLLRLSEDGWIYVVYREMGPAIHIHRPDGSPTGRTLGRRGEGPGEFFQPRDLEVHDDTVRVADPLMQRITEFDRITGEILRTLRVPTQQFFLSLDDGRFVVGGPLAFRETAGYPLHVYSATGAWERSFGLDEPVLRPGMRELHARAIQRGDGSTFWAARRNEYRIELWDASTGRLIRTLLGDRAWFEPWDSMERIELGRNSPRPTILGQIVLDADGLLWIAFSRPKQDWQAAFDAADTGEVDTMGRPIRDPNKLFEAVVEVVDPVEGVVLARRILPNLAGFAGPGRLYRSWLDEGGLPKVEIVPIRLVGR